MLEIESFLLLAGSFGTGYSIEKTGDTVFIFIGKTFVSSVKQVNMSIVRYLIYICAQYTLKQNFENNTNTCTYIHKTNWDNIGKLLVLTFKSVVSTFQWI
jgi:hypothetical protein